MGPPAALRGLTLEFDRPHLPKKKKAKCTLGDFGFFSCQYKTQNAKKKSACGAQFLPPAALRGTWGLRRPCGAHGASDGPARGLPWEFDRPYLPKKKAKGTLTCLCLCGADEHTALWGFCDFHPQKKTAFWEFVVVHLKKKCRILPAKKHNIAVFMPHFTTKKKQNVVFYAAFYQQKTGKRL
jgi:hypothetical protein